MTVPTQLPAWKALEAHHKEIAPLQMRDLFRQDPKRFEKFSLRFNDILFDFSKNRITAQTLSLLFDLARQADLQGWTEKMFTGQNINTTDAQPDRHTRLRT